MLHLEGLHKRFGGTVAVDGLSLDVRRGEVFGLVGFSIGSSVFRWSDAR